MPDSSSRQRLLTSIEAKRATAERLLPLATHATITELIRLAIRDLDEAVVWLNHKDVATRIAEMTIGFATMRLAMAKKAIDSYGSDAEIRTI